MSGQELAVILESKVFETFKWSKDVNKKYRSPKQLSLDEKKTREIQMLVCLFYFENWKSYFGILRKSVKVKIKKI